MSTRGRFGTDGLTDFFLENQGVVYLALNDILNHYDTKKKAQNAVKSAKHGVSLWYKIYYLIK